MNDTREYQLVSIEEMRELAKSKAYYLPEEELKFEDWSDNDLKCTVQIKWWKPNLLRDHLLFEECMSGNNIDWRFTTHAYDFRMIAYMRYLWYNPLVWVPVPDELKNKRIIVGRVAEERYVRRDGLEKYGTPIAFDFGNEMLDWFVRKMPKFDGSEWTDIFEANYVTPDICLWYYLTMDDTELRLSIEQGGAFDLSLIKQFSPHVFVYNIKQIAEWFGGAKAIEILLQFRKDWQRIVALKLFGLNRLTAEQIEEFRACLFEGMDYYLEQWESEQAEKEEKPQETASILFTKKAKKEGKEAEIIEGLKQSMSGRKDKARALVEEVRSWQKEGYIDSNYNASVMYEELNKILVLPFKYGGFRKYYNE